MNFRRERWKNLWRENKDTAQCRTYNFKRGAPAFNTVSRGAEETYMYKKLCSVREVASDPALFNASHTPILQNRNQLINL